jgi:mannose-1-phosphate guanylyltransferase
MHDIQIIIMAGGVGSRFWPMSTPDYPKQFIGKHPTPILAV